MKSLACFMITLAAVTLLLSPASAQRLTDKGLKVGLNIANLSADLSDIAGFDKSTRTGVSVGGFLIYRMTPTLSVQPEILYTAKGATFKGEEQGMPVKVVLKLSYVEIPMLARFSVDVASRSLQPCLVVGPVLSIKTGSTVKVTTQVTGQSVSAEVGLSEEVKRMDFGMTFGAGLRMKEGIVLEVRYTLGLTTIDPSGTDTIKNRGLSVMAGYAF